MPDLIDQLSSLKPKCERCGWKHGGFHICVDLSDPISEAKVLRRMSRKSRDASSKTQTERWQQYRESNRERDNRIIRMYSEGGVGYPTIAKRFNISKTTVQKILKQAESEGRVKIRPRGTTVAKGAV